MSSLGNSHAACMIFGNMHNIVHTVNICVIITSWALEQAGTPQECEALQIE